MTYTDRHGEDDRLIAEPLAYAVPALIALAVALVAFGGEPLRLLLRYERDALADGELWRLVTAHLAHLGPGHTVMNLAALLVLAFVFGRSLRPPDWLGSGLTAALAIDAGLFSLEPEIGWYVGLSGILHGYWAVGCCRLWHDRRAEALALAGLLAAKLGWEMLGGPIPMTRAIATGPVVTVAHAYGAFGALLWPISALLIRRARSASL